MKPFSKLALVIALIAIAGQVSFASEPAVMSAQQALIEKGYDPGVADGLWGAKTANAIRAFQKASDLPQNGQLDEETATLLGVEPWSPPSPKFDSVAFQYAVHAEVIGGAGAALSGGNLVPQSGVTVYVFREIMDADLANRLGVKVGGAYTENNGSFTYIRDVDLEKSNEEIAQGFGVGD